MLNLKAIYLFAMTMLLISCGQSTFSDGGGKLESRRDPEEVDENETSGDAEGSDDNPNQSIGGQTPDGEESEPEEEIEEEVEETVPEIAVTREFLLTVESTSKSVEVMILVDTSGSMNGEKASLQKNMPGFLSKLETSLSSGNYRVHLIADGFDFGSLASDKFVVHETKISSNDALSKLTQFFNNELFAEGSASTAEQYEVVIFTDDNAQFSNLGSADDESATDAYVGYVRTALSKHGILGRTKFNGVIGLPTSNVGENSDNGVCEIPNTGHTYLGLAAATDIGGDIFDLCEPDWDSMIPAIAESITKRAKSVKMKLALGGRKAKIDAVEYQGNVLAASQYRLIGETLEILHKPVIEQGGEIKVKVTFLD